MKLIVKPYLLFLLAVPIPILYGLLNQDETVNINIGNTYYVIRQMDFSLLISVLFSIVGIGYWIMLKAKIRLSKWLTWMHVAVSLCGTLFILILSQLFRESTAYDFNENLTLAIHLIAMLVVFGQILYPINIMYGLLRKLKKN